MSERLTKVMNDPSYGGCGGVILAKCENCTTRLSSCYEDDCGKQVEANQKLAIIENMLCDADGNEVISLARLRELADAERDERIVIRPKCEKCKHFRCSYYAEPCYSCIGQGVSNEKGYYFEEAARALAEPKGEATT